MYLPSRTHRKIDRWFFIACLVAAALLALSPLYYREYRHKRELAAKIAAQKAAPVTMGAVQKE